MSKKIHLYYHAGFYTKSLTTTLSNLVKFKKFYQPVYNVGDQLSPIVVSGLAQRPVKYSPAFSKRKLIAIGSILAGVKPGDIVWGAGLKLESHVQFVKKYTGKFEIKAVRGPETRKILLDNGIDCPEVYGDPALLLPLIYPRQKTKEFRMGLIPHLRHLHDFGYEGLKRNTLLISPAENWQRFVEKICSCDFIVSSSLHGVIIADAYGVPAVPMFHGGHLKGSAFKFQDYFHATNRELEFADSSEIHDEDIILDRIQKLGVPQIDLMPLLSSFPYLDAASDFPRRLTQHFG